MRMALRRKTIPQARVTHQQSYAPPVGGWNARDSLASMKPHDAVMLVNFFPTTSYIEGRGGFESHATGMTGTGKTLMVYNKLNGSNQMFCTTVSGTYNVSSAGAVGASVLARTNGKHRWTMFGDGSSQWLIAANGVDKPAYYDGTTWTAVDGATTPALTGITSTDVASVHVFKGRLLFLFNSSLKFGYLAAGAAGGAVSLFDLSGEAAKGGYLIAYGTWSRDGGSGPDDFAVFFTSEGEAIVYQGTNPNSATTWAKVGSFTIGKPIGRNCVIQYGTDCAVLTQDGLFPMTALLQATETQREQYAFSYKIQNAFREAGRSYASVFGWKISSYPSRGALLVNVPKAEDGIHEQYVMNTVTKAWCKFTGWDAEDWAVFNGDLYFTDGTVVYKAWTGTSDAGANIDFYGKQAFQTFGTEEVKQVKLYLPILAVNGNVTYAADVDVDFADDEITNFVTATVVAGAVWDTSNWDEAYWASDQSVVKQWTSPAEYPGRWISNKVKCRSNALTIQWMGNTIIWEEAPSL